MGYRVWFWRPAAVAPGAAGLSDEQVAGALGMRDWRCVAPAAELADFRRDVLASDPDWRRMSLLPRPGSPEPADRYLALDFSRRPGADQLRDLRYIAARNRLRMYDPQAR